MIKKWKSFINESINSNVLNFYNEYKDLFYEEELSNIEIYDEVGELTLKYNLSKEDVEYVINNLDISFDINGFLKSTYDNWVDDISKITDIDLKSKIEDIIHNNIELRQVPYSQIDDMEIDPDSINLATNEIIKMLKKEGLI